MQTMQSHLILDIRLRFPLLNLCAVLHACLSLRVMALSIMRLRRLGSQELARPSILSAAAGDVPIIFTVIWRVKRREVVGVLIMGGEKSELGPP